MKQDLLNAVDKMIVRLDGILQNSISSYRDRKEASECYLSISLLHDFFELDPASAISLEYLMNRIVDKICHEEYFMYYMYDKYRC